MTGTRGSPLPDEKLDEIRARAEAATVGPWKATRYTSPDAPTTGGWSKADKERYGWVSFSRKRDEPYTTSPLEHPDAAFIAHARTDIPLLLEALAAERADRERLLEATELGEAWADADAALRETNYNSLRVTDYSHGYRGKPDPRVVFVSCNLGGDLAVDASGPTPAAALRAFAAKLRAESVPVKARAALRDTAP